MTPQEIVESIKAIIKGQAAAETSVQLTFFEEKRESVITLLRLIQPSLANADNVTINGYYDIAVKEYTSVYPVDMDPSTALTRKDFHSWLTDERRKNLPTHYINRYLTWLRAQGRSEKVIAE